MTQVTPTVAIVSDAGNRRLRLRLKADLPDVPTDLGTDSDTSSYEELVERCARWLDTHPGGICLAISTSGNGFAIEGNKHGRTIAAHCATELMIPDALAIHRVTIFDLPGHYPYPTVLRLARALIAAHREQY